MKERSYRIAESPPFKFKISHAQKREWTETGYGVIEPRPVKTRRDYRKLHTFTARQNG